MEMFSQSELLLMIGVVSVLLLGITVLAIFDIKEYLNNKKGLIIEEETSLEKYEEKEEKLEPIMVMEEETSNIEKEENLEEAYLEEVEEDQIEVKPELNPIIAEEEEVYLPKVEIETPEVEISEIKEELSQPIIETNDKLDVFEELDEIENNLPNKKDDITNFEAEQERTAIISLDELLKRSNELYNDNEIEQYDDGNEPISIDEVIKMFKHDESVKEEKIVPEQYQDVVEEKVPYSKKETIPFISSVYGIEKENNALEFENTATYDKLDREKYSDFVAQLKEMNENK